MTRERNFVGLLKRVGEFFCLNKAKHLKLDGFEVCRQIGANPKTKNIKIMIMSARKSKEDVIRCYKLGIEDYIVKPFTLEDLEQRIKRLLEHDQL